MIKESKGATGIFDHVICLAKLEIARVFINLGEKRYIYIYLYIYDDDDDENNA